MEGLHLQPGIHTEPKEFMPGAQGHLTSQGGVGGEAPASSTTQVSKGIESRMIPDSLGQKAEAGYSRRARVAGRTVHLKWSTQ